MRYAITKDGQICNIILWDGESDYEPEDGTELFEAPDEVAIGWTRVDDEWIAPEPAEVEIPAEDPAVVQAKEAAMQSLVNLGVPEASARTIVGLPPA